MNKHEIRTILENKDIDRVKEFVTDVARKLAPIYEQEHGKKDLSFCMVIVACEADPCKRAAAIYLDKLRKDLLDPPKAVQEHIFVLDSMISATYACIVENEDEIINHSITSLERAIAASAASREINNRVNMCIQRWKSNWRGYIGSQ